MKKVNLDDIKTFYDPHPGFAGATITIPGPVKKVADRLDGQKLSVRKALEKLQAVTGGKLKIEIMDINFISLEIKTADGLRHSFRVICFR